MTVTDPIAVAGFAWLAWGLVQPRVWPTVLGASLVVLAQLWRIDRLGRLDEERSRAGEATRG